MNTFNSNDYALGKEYQNRMQSKIQRMQQADTLLAQQENRQIGLSAPKIRTIALMLVITVVLFTSISGAYLG